AVRPCCVSSCCALLCRDPFLPAIPPPTAEHAHACPWLSSSVWRHTLVSSSQSHAPAHWLWQGKHVKLVEVNSQKGGGRSADVLESAGSCRAHRAGRQDNEWSKAGRSWKP